jgi:hypothetical protein
MVVGKEGTVEAEIWVESIAQSFGSMNRRLVTMLKRGF